MYLRTCTENGDLGKCPPVLSLWLQCSGAYLGLNNLFGLLVLKVCTTLQCCRQDRCSVWPSSVRSTSGRAEHRGGDQSSMVHVGARIATAGVRAGEVRTVAPCIIACRFEDSCSARLPCPSLWQ